jgi:DNA mismatch repair protein MutS
VLFRSKVFSRIGASDDLSKGQSTFMVEMSETANILHNATKKSLVILDEIGRGTSTYDGISIAWAVAEYLLRPNCSPKTLFATHYTELTELDLEYKGVKNFCVAVHEAEEGIVFLHKIIAGGADKSYGIHVAKLAGLPKDVLVRARTLLAELEEKHKPKVGVTKKKSKEKQLTFFDDYKEIEKEEILQSLVELDLNEVTPMQALMMLSEWKKRL